MRKVDSSNILLNHLPMGSYQRVDTGKEGSGHGYKLYKTQQRHSVHIVTQRTHRRN